eukprot:scaffold1320_cov113-Isochrysis_galbana.AAC.7
MFNSLFVAMPAAACPEQGTRARSQALATLSIHRHRGARIFHKSRAAGGTICAMSHCGCTTKSLANMASNFVVCGTRGSHEPRGEVRGGGWYRAQSAALAHRGSAHNPHITRYTTHDAHNAQRTTGQQLSERYSYSSAYYSHMDATQHTAAGRGRGRLH